ncbi:MAG: inositol monophosphatase [Akkermansiaceae bacterium]|nr:inositol monophosphatase [Akkermansiaceae bacterium]
MNYEEHVNLAVTAARRAGAFLRARFHEVHLVDEETAHDIKLRLDKETQSLIVGILSARFPAYSVLGEEGEVKGCSADMPEWVIDPIDGTVNYFYGIPIFCVSIALRVGSKIVLGCVYDPMQDECFTVCEGQRPSLNGKEISVSARSRMAEAVVFIGHGTHDGSGATGIARFAHVSAQVKKIRILGSAALTLCYIAAGRFDAYIENRINLWDFAAARAILEAAGGCFEYTPTSADALSGSVIAWNGKLPVHTALQLP